MKKTFTLVLVLVALFTICDRTLTASPIATSQAVAPAAAPPRRGTSFSVICQPLCCDQACTCMYKVTRVNNTCMYGPCFCN